MQKYTKGKVYIITYCIDVKTKENIQNNNKWLDIGKKLSLKNTKYLILKLSKKLDLLQKS